MPSSWFSHKRDFLKSWAKAIEGKSKFPNISSTLGVKKEGGMDLRTFFFFEKHILNVQKWRGVDCTESPWTQAAADVLPKQKMLTFW